MRGWARFSSRARNLVGQIGSSSEPLDVSVLLLWDQVADPQATWMKIRDQVAVNLEVIVVSEQVPLDVSVTRPLAGAIKKVRSLKAAPQEGLSQAWSMADADHVVIAAKTSTWRKSTLKSLLRVVKGTPTAASVAAVSLGIKDLPKHGLLAKQPWEKPQPDSQISPVTHELLSGMLGLSGLELTCWNRARFQPETLLSSHMGARSLSQAWASQLAELPQITIAGPVGKFESKTERLVEGELTVETSRWEGLLASAADSALDPDSLAISLLERDVWKYVEVVDSLSHDEAQILATATNQLSTKSRLLCLNHPYKTIFYAAYEPGNPDAVRDIRTWMELPLQAHAVTRSETIVHLDRSAAAFLAQLDEDLLDITRFVIAPSTITRLSYSAERIVIRGWAYQTLLASAENIEISVSLQAGGGTIQLPTARRLEPWVQEESTTRLIDLQESGFECEIDPSDLSSNIEWTLVVRVAVGGIVVENSKIALHRWIENALPDTVALGDGNTLRIKKTAGLALTVENRDEASRTRAQGNLTSGVIDNGVLQIRGRGVPDERGNFTLLEPTGSVVRNGAWVCAADGQLRVDVPLTPRPEVESEKPLANGVYSLRFTGKQGLEIRDAEAWLPTEYLSSEMRAILFMAGDGQLALEIRSPLRVDERGVFNQRRMSASLLGQGRTTIVPGSVFLSSFGGKGLGCHPFAIGEEFASRRDVGPIYADVLSHIYEVPRWAQAVIRGTREWFEALGTSAVIVNNTTFGDFALTAEPQFYLQTWHGTPLKRIGHDVEKISFSLQYLKRTDNEAAYMWGDLLSPSAFASEVLPRALSFGGAALELGSPRLDKLVNDANYARNRVREHFRIGQQEKVVLYAPTWRDGGKPSELLDLEQCVAGLPDDVIFMVRAHPNVWGQGAKKNFDFSDRIIDSSGYPVVEELYSAADVLITDYSSVLFDFAVTGRPQFHFAPDLDTYRDDVRGFYIDIAECALGPVASTTSQVIELIKDRDHSWQADDDAYRAFQQRFLPREDGSASARVVDHLIEQARLRGTWS